MSSSSSSSWGRLAAVGVPTALLASAAGYLYYQFAQEKKEVATRKAKKAEAAAHAAANPPSPLAQLSNEILRDVSGRQRGLADPRREAKIFAWVRPGDKCIVPYDKLATVEASVRSDIGEWIILAHASRTPLLDGVPVLQGTSTTIALANKKAQEAFDQVDEDYELAWKLIASVMYELDSKPFASLSPTESSMLVGIELILLDLAHKMRAKQRMLNMYEQIHKRHFSDIVKHVKQKESISAEDADPTAIPESAASSNNSDEKLFTLWMLSPLLGRWNDFLTMSNLVEQKGQSLDEFHHLAIQRPDILDFRQLRRFLKAGKEADPPQTFVEPSSTQLEWSINQIHSMVWKFQRSAGDDEESIATFCAGKAMYNTWTPIPIGNANFRSLGATVRIKSMITNQMPVVGPYLSYGNEKGEGKVFTAQGAVMFRTQAAEGKPSRLLQLREEYREFKRVPQEEVEKIIRQNIKKEEKKKVEEEEDKIKEVTEEEEAAEAKKAEEEAAAAAAAAASSSSEATADDTTPLPLSEYDPADPPHIWVGTYVFGQYEVNETSPGEYDVAKEPFMHVEYELTLKMKQVSNTLKQ